MAIGISPDPLNYFIGKGILKWKPEGAGSYRDFGNATFETTINPTKLDHWSNRTGIRTKDRQVVTQMEMSCKFGLDEFTADNLTIALMATQDTDGTLSIGGSPQVIGAIRLIGTNEVGLKFQVDAPTVSVTPSAALSFISDGWGVIELAGEVLADANGIFGLVYTGITEEIDP